MLDCIIFLSFDESLINVFGNGIAFKSDFYIPPKALQEEDNVLRSKMRLSVIMDLVSLVFYIVPQLDKRR